MNGYSEAILMMGLIDSGIDSLVYPKRSLEVVLKTKDDVGACFQKRMRHFYLQLRHFCLQFVLFTYIGKTASKKYQT